MDKQKDKQKDGNQLKKDSPLQPDPETLHTTDPQEEMKGPVSSLMQNIKEKAEEPQEPEEDDDQKKKPEE